MPLAPYVVCRLYKTVKFICHLEMPFRRRLSPDTLEVLEEVRRQLVAVATRAARPLSGTQWSNSAAGAMGLFHTSRGADWLRMTPISAQLTLF